MKKDLLKDSIEMVEEGEVLDIDIDMVERVHKMKLAELEAKKSKGSKVNWDLIINGGISLLSILAILNYEKENIITSKSFGIASKWIGRGK